MNKSIEAAGRELDPRPSYRVTAKHLREMASQERHTEAVADCRHCTLMYAAVTLEKLADKHFAGAGVEAEMVEKPDAPQPQIFTTKQVATILKVSSRTVTKWYDSGRLKGYRIPGSQVLKFPLEYVVKFCKQHGMSTGDLEPQSETTLSKGG